MRVAAGIRNRRSGANCICLLLLLAGASGAQESLSPVVLDPVLVNVTRSAGRSFDLPIAVNVIDAATLHDGQPMVNLSETLIRVPGIVALNRQNYAQDLQISSRGFGARSTFGVRGIRLYQDGIPATMPDGQGQTGSFGLFSTRRVEVLRGPFSTLYGNAAGGVIALYTEDGTPTPEATINTGAGSYGAWTAAAKLTGTGRLAEQNAGYAVAASRFDIDGYREHSWARRDLANAKVAFDAGPDTRVAVVASMQYQPESQDPLGLTRAQWAANPRGVDPAALIFDTRKTIRQEQGGATIEQQLGDATTLRLVGYLGSRAIRQYLALSGVGATSSGGVTDLDRDYGGFGMRVAWRGDAGGVPLTLTAGAEWDRQSEHRRGYVNDNGNLGDLRRDEDDRVTSTAVYAQAEASPLPALGLTAGLRWSGVDFRSTDLYVNASNPDDSGARRFGNAGPVLGAVYHVSDAINVYASYGAGFETPTLIELAYRNGGTGLNFELQPSTSRNGEIGVKANIATGHRVNAALFATNTSNEIVIDTATGGRTVYKNAGRTERRGIEVMWDARWLPSLSSHIAYTALRAVFADSFTSGSPPATVDSGSRLPGVPATSGYADLVFVPGGFGGFNAALEVQHTGSLWVNDRNTDAAPSATVANLRIGFEQRTTAITWREFVRANNITNRNYSGSVIVNDTNGRYFEPAPRQNWFAGVTMQMMF